MSTMIIVRFFLTLFVFAVITLPANASDPLPRAQVFLDGIENRYAGNSFSAEFVQTSTLSALDISETATGKAWFSHPGKMKWQYLSPERHDIITNGKTLWIYRPDENQVMQGDAAQFFKSGTGGAFLSDISVIRKNYDVSLGQTGEDWVELSLEDPAGNPDIHRIIIRISVMEFHIFSVTTINAVGDTTRFELNNILFQPMPKDWFEFSVPPGVSVIDMN
jgi:outer membrane lipoprotein carrier protein